MTGPRVGLGRIMVIVRAVMRVAVVAYIVGLLLDVPWFALRDAVDPWLTLGATLALVVGTGVEVVTALELFEIRRVTAHTDDPSYQYARALGRDLREASEHLEGAASSLKAKGQGQAALHAHLAARRFKARAEEVLGG